MNPARELLEIAAEYVEARESVALAAGMDVPPAADLDEIAARWETALEGYVAQVR